MRRYKHTFFLTLFALLLVLSAIGATFIGAIAIPAADVWHSFLRHLHLSATEVPDYFDIALWQLRFPRIVMSLLAGAGLGICGCVFQSIFRNPICDPYILGISSGASLGAAVAIILGWDALLFGITLPALATSLLTLLLVIGIANLRKQHATQTLLLTGIALNFFISAIITLLMVLKQESMEKILFWTMGSLSAVSWTEVACAAPTLLVIAGFLLFHSKNLNIIQLGSDSAQSLGVNAPRVIRLTLIASSLLIGVIVSFCGVIGFIGLIVPHICRLVFGSNNRHLFLYAMLFGAFFLLLADTLARTLAVPSELPVGSITALTGAPYFIFLLLRGKH